MNERSKRPFFLLSLILPYHVELEQMLWGPWKDLPVILWSPFSFGLLSSAFSFLLLSKQLRDALGWAGATVLEWNVGICFYSPSLGLHFPFPSPPPSTREDWVIEKSALNLKSSRIRKEYLDISQSLWNIEHSWNGEENKRGSKSTVVLKNDRVYLGRLAEDPLSA